MFEARVEIVLCDVTDVFTGGSIWLHLASSSSLHLLRQSVSISSISVSRALPVVRFQVLLAGRTIDLSFADELLFFVVISPSTRLQSNDLKEDFLRANRSFTRLAIWKNAFVNDETTERNPIEMDLERRTSANRWLNVFGVHWLLPLSLSLSPTFFPRDRVKREVRLRPGLWLDPFPPSIAVVVARLVTGRTRILRHQSVSMCRTERRQR